MKLKDKVCGISMEQNKVEMKSEEKSGDREEEIEPRAHLCETRWIRMKQK